MTKPIKIILASKSPRRQELIKGLEIPYSVYTYDTDESFPAHLQAEQIASYLADKKSKAYPLPLADNEILLTADTIVWINNHVLNKPANEKEALDMLQEIAGKTHQVYTGICLRSANKQVLFTECSEVTCRNMTTEHLLYYIQHYHPFDKAGSYGIQDFFGYTAVEKINGCFYNVMGLPVGRIYKELGEFGIAMGI